ncbi:hypothetical protein [Thermosynechococcus vestitus]|uniref:Tsr1145 protein n=1 Tax=Thermosynechococcus vestitus (strain NIES-2133 / IAM M-273 / BP-1) TaxID=197221 RepID=Q8DJS7_THEVB|nr:hypothetical protein [Thermosynechococcus vestitus]BAC08697.1 tsr1145 [Thermosynechococcus vestitus BP-1]BAY52245.1 hypothetical protein NIES2134_101510 [Thermostichus vulcanus NIES-2134]
MTPSLLRQFWHFVGQVQGGRLLSMDDRSLQGWLVTQFSDVYPLEHHQRHHLERYISSRLALIREVASDSTPRSFGDRP